MQITWAYFLDFLKRPGVMLCLEWVGSLLMMVAFWRWIYDMVAGSLSARARDSAQRILPDFAASFPDVYEKSLNRSQGQSESTHRGLLGIVLSSRRENKKRSRRIANGEVTESEMEVLAAKYDAGLRHISALKNLLRNTGRDILAFLWYDSMRLLADRVFTGRIARLVFAIGFILWNLSKLGRFLSLAN